ncbi:MAG: hypothetical protein M1826_002739 [Phylliscum demangeonii]|nr:MAG: hypothetical protein M1826_002739 [Phylliscum demangeonii]
MGVPKFFRWLSERYPAISQLIAENRIPEFDCLYLDMNGIIHNCTHKDSDSPTFRLTEDKMFLAIFNYIEHLFGKIKPKKLFFMAIDGVAPRAKMNQQRARRFRTALEVEVAKEKAIREGVEMPTEEAFDSNCITPGTEFMAKLTKQLKYFINKKISEDAEWQGVEVVLSGHEVPGEGEHKIMEYIRLAKAQPDYDPNVRHCLYGLDADLIMLGLLSHDPHFCLLREEVTFGRQGTKKSKELEHQNFYLMHLCIVREYLELEFQELKEPGVLDFPFDMERVIDDFILMAFFVGNDFLPNLPNLHINEGALALMFKIYKSVLPKAKGYINESGVINLDRLQMLLEELSDVEFRFFEAENADASWFKGKQMARVDVMEKGKRKGAPPVVSSVQNELFLSVKTFVAARTDDNDATDGTLSFPSNLPARDRKFVQDLADDLHLPWKTVENDNGERQLQLAYPERQRMEESEDEFADEEAQIALRRVLKQYEKAKVQDLSADNVQEQAEIQYQAKFRKWKDDYYRSKLGWDLSDEEPLRQLAENYVQGLQWVLYYYYKGVVSWPWFYAYHYSPMISDVKKGLGANLKFELGLPFRPYQQLMGVLPDRSKKIVPVAYQDLMTSPDSPIIDFYPREFELDMNGKKMEWEAVVKIPFIDEARLLGAMRPRDALLLEDERIRNDFGVTLKFSYSPDLDYTYPSSLVGMFPDLTHCHCVVNIFELPTLEGLDIHVGLMDGVKLGAAALAGFPSLKVLPHIGVLAFGGVSIFQQESRNESMIITLQDPEERSKVDYAKARLGKKAHVGYPFLQEGRIVRVSDELFDYMLPPGDGSQGNRIIPIPHGPSECDWWRKRAGQMEKGYSRRLGMEIGVVECMVHVEVLKGLRKSADGAIRKEYGEVQGVETDYAAQVVVETVDSEDQRFLEKTALPIEEEFPEGSRAFFLGEFNYGRPLEVLRASGNQADVWIASLKGREADFGRQFAAQAERTNPYTPSYAVARQLGLNALALSKITSSFTVMLKEQRLNLGLNLKFEARKLKVLGYSRRSRSGWEFSQKAIELVQQYMIQFPEFIAGIQRKPHGDVYLAEEFYPAPTAAAKIKAIQAWLTSIEAKHFERVPLDAEQLDSDVVQQIEQAADQNLRRSAGIEGQKVRAVPRSALLKPADAEHRLGNQRFAVGDRVVYAQDSGKVPIAVRGTVVGLTCTSRVVLVDVVFDVTFMSGSSLGDRCSPFRGSTVPASSLLNLTDRQLVITTKPGPAPPFAAPLPGPRYGPPMGPRGRGQFVDAPTPPVPAQPWTATLAIRGASGPNHPHPAPRPASSNGRGNLYSTTGFHTRGHLVDRRLLHHSAPPGSHNVAESSSTQQLRQQQLQQQQTLQQQQLLVHLQIQQQRIQAHGPGYIPPPAMMADANTNAAIAFNHHHQGNRGSGPRSYNRVPPPASLDLPAPTAGARRVMGRGLDRPRGRGRGLGRGRGRGMVRGGLGGGRGNATGGGGGRGNENAASVVGLGGE